jgi:hypothetical protein
VLFNKFTMPGHILAAMSLLVLILLLLLFKNPPSTQQDDPQTSKENTSSYYSFPTPTSESLATFLPTPAEPSALTKPQKILVFGVFLGLNFMVRLGIIETIGTPLYMDLHGGSPPVRRFLIIFLFSAHDFFLGDSNFDIGGSLPISYQTNDFAKNVEENSKQKNIRAKRKESSPPYPTTGKEDIYKVQISLGQSIWEQISRKIIIR